MVGFICYKLFCFMAMPTHSHETKFAIVIKLTVNRPNKYCSVPLFPF